MDLLKKEYIYIIIIVCSWFYFPMTLSIEAANMFGKYYYYIFTNYIFVSICYFFLLKNNKSLFSPVHIFSVFIFFIFYITPMWLINEGKGAEFGYAIYGGCIEATTLSTIGLLCFYLSFSLTKNKTKLSLYRDNVQNKKYVLKCTKYIIVILLGVNILILMSTGKSLMFILTMGQGQYVRETGVTDQFEFLINLVYFMLVPWLVYCIYEKSIIKRLIVTYLIFVVFSIYGWRFIIYIMLISFAIAYCRIYNKKISVLTVLIACIAMFVYSIFLGQVRGSIRTGTDYRAVEHENDGISQTLESNFNIYNSFYAIVDNCPQKQAHTYGEALLVAPVRMWIPRAIWKDKPKPDTSVKALFNSISGAEARALAFPIFYEYYLDFGGLGVIVCSLLLGFICKRSIDLYHRNSLIAILFYAILCGFWIQYINRSYSGQLCTLFGFLFLPLVYYKKIAKVK